MRPLLVVPGLFSTDIHDDQLGCLWGTLRCLYGGPPLATTDGLAGAPRQVLKRIPLVPGISYDLLGALERALVRAGYRLGETLHYFAYDWRHRVIDLGARLATEIKRLAERFGGPLDVLGLSNGGLTVRAAFAADAALPIERVVTSGAPHAGVIETLACFDVGFKFAPFGRTVTPEEFMACPGGLDSIPSPRAAAFISADSGDYDLYDLDTWRRLRLSVFKRDPDAPVWVAMAGKRLAESRETWRVLDTAAPPRRLICICGVGLPTQARIVVRDGRAFIPGEGRTKGLPADAITDGDGAIALEGAHAWTGAAPEIVRIPVRRHRDMVRTKPAFEAILAALR